MFNVGGAGPATLQEIAETLAALGSGRSSSVLPYTLRDMPVCRAAIDIGDFVTDDRKFRGRTGWRPRMGLAEGLRATVDWFRPRLHLYA